MKNILVCLTLIFVGCNSHQKSSENVSQEDSLRNELIGTWGNPNEAVAVWKISRDSIYYFQRHIAYPFKIHNHDLIVYFPDSKGTMRNITVVKDTMFFWDEVGEVIKGLRFKAK